VNGFVFMCAPNNTLYYAVHCIFDESMFPKCPKQAKLPTTRLHKDVPMHHHHMDEEVYSPTQVRKSTKNPPEPSQEETDDSSSSESEVEPVRAPSPPPLRRSTRERKPVKWPGSVYGETCNPTDILKENKETRKEWRQIEGTVPGTSGRQPRPSLAPEPRVPTPEEQPPPPESDEEGEGNFWGLFEQKRLVTSKGDTLGGGVSNLSFLLAKAVSPTANATTDPKTWGYKDMTRLPQLEQQPWHEACQQELEALAKHKVFELVPRPRDRKVIKNQWVFDVKADGRKHARLVAKGFSQVEGLDYDQIFSPVVRFETVRLILAMAALNDWYLTGLDVRNTFLYGELDEEIYMEQPEGFRVPGQESAVLKLMRALYGLKQAGLTWW